MRAVSTLSVLIALCSACSSPPPAPDDVAHDAASGAPPDATMQPVDAGGDGAMPGPDGGKDGSTCSHFCDSYFPLAVGLRWDYKFTRGARSGCNDGTVNAQIVETLLDNVGRTVFHREFSCGSYTSTRFRDDGSEIWAGLSAAEYRYLTLPPVDGAQWQASNGSGTKYRWKSVGTMTVPAGTFTDCWRQELPDYPSYLVHCRGVGTIVLDDQAFGRDERWELTARNF